MAKRNQVIECNICHTSNFNTYRYKCLICEEFDICGFCFERHLEFGKHKLSHLMFKINSLNVCSELEISEDENLNLDNLEEIFEECIHKEKCKICMKIIKGLKLKCNFCYKYYQCQKCHLKKKVSDKHIYGKHPMIVCNDKEIDLDYSKIKILGELGRGGFGVVYKAKYDHKVIIDDEGGYAAESIVIALKKIEQRTQKKEEEEYLFKFYLRELDAYNEIKGENILQMIGSCISNDGLYIATEYIQNGSLTKMLAGNKKFGLYERLKVAFGMICGIKRIHANGFFHKDIKPDNVLITNDFNAKIADFGTAKIIMDNETNFTGTATYSYTPPEFFKFLSGNPKPNLDDLQGIDIFSLGLTLVEIFKGTHGRKDSKIGPIVIKIPPEYFQELINKCVSLDASERPTIDQIFNYLVVLIDFIQFLSANKFKNLDSYDIDKKFQIIDESCILFQRDFTVL